MSKLAKRLDAHFVACAAAAGAAVVGTVQTADAAIVYSGVVNIPVQQTTNGLYINIVTHPAPGSINEPGNTTGGTVAGWDLNLYSSTPLAWSGGQLNWGYVGTGTSTVSQLAANAPINGATINLTNTGNMSAFPTAGGSLFGFRFFNEVAAQVQFGWGRFIKATGASPATGTLVDFAYENTGGSIGAGAVPAPGSLALLALGALGVAGRRRK